MRSRLRKAVALGSGCIVAGIALAVPGQAAATPSLSGIALDAPSTIERGETVGYSSFVTFETTESATFILVFGGDGIFGVAGECNAETTQPVSCLTQTGTPIAITIGSDGDGVAEESVSATLRIGMDTATNIPLSSTEGSSPPAAPRTLVAVATGTGNTLGAANTSEQTSVVSNTATDAEIQLTTTAPAAGTSVPRGAGSTVGYTATLTRTGRIMQGTGVSVSLIADTAAGTSPGPSVGVSFGVGETSKTVTIPVTVPAGATFGSASYHFVATWDPAFDVGIVDTETGATRQFTVVPGADLDLSTPTPSQTVFTDEIAPIEVVLTNTGPDSAARGGAGPRVSFEIASSGPGSAAFSPAVAFVPGLAGSCALGLTAEDVVCDVAAPLASGSSVTMRLPVTATGETTAAVNLVDVDSDLLDPTPPALAATAEFVQRPDSSTPLPPSPLIPLTPPAGQPAAALKKCAKVENKKKKKKCKKRARRRLA